MIVQVESESGKHVVKVKNTVIVVTVNEEDANEFALYIEKGIAAYRVEMAVRALHLATSDPSEVLYNTIHRSERFKETMGRDPELAQAIKEGKKVLATKRIRELTGLPLGLSKDLADKYFNV